MSDQPPNEFAPCDCCEDLPRSARYNRPGLPEIDYRLGTYGQLLEQLLAQISRLTLPEGVSLQALKTRSLDDGAIALLDAWAIVADVLTFYQERIANEGFLGTATERRSVLELARAIGYELNPGVAASTYLAFTVDRPPADEVVTLPAGLQVQSLPKDGQLPQTFEMSTEFVARPEWNEFYPQRQQAQTLSTDTSAVYLQGTPRIQVGDWVVLVTQNPELSAQAKQVIATTPEPEQSRTLVLLAAPAIALNLLFFQLLSPYITVNLLGFSDYAIATAVTAFLGSGSSGSATALWREADLSEIARLQGVQVRDIASYVNQSSSPPAAANLAELEPGFYHLQTRANPFGHNAPRWDSLPLAQRYSEVVEETADELALEVDPPVPVPYLKSWDAGDGPSITTGSQQDSDYFDQPNGFYCDRPIAEIVPGSLVVLESPTQVQPYRVSRVQDKSLADFALTGKATGVRVQAIEDAEAEVDLAGYRLRSTTIHGHSQRLALAPIEITEDVGQGTDEAQQITLDRLVTELQIGQAIALTGQASAPPQARVGEIAFLKDIVHASQTGPTTLLFSDPLQHRYQRSSLTLQANVVPATHGETVAAEVLGNGDATQPNQRFFLKKPPLTYVPAPTPSGAASTLQIRVNQVLWQEVSGFYGLPPTAEVYTVRLNDEGAVQVIFGDGEQGARLPTGLETAIARYRSGIGLSGEVGADTLTLLKQRPLGVQTVTNPLAATGAEDPETLATARTNAPLTVLTLDRIVSQQDYEDFARAYGGIGKAQAIALWNGRYEQVHLTIGGANGQPIADTAVLYKALKAAIQTYGDPGQRFSLGTFAEVFFRITARLRIDARFEVESVQATVKAQLYEAFSFERRQFAQVVSAAEVVTLIQSVEGIVSVDLEALYRFGATPQPQTYLEALPARWKATQEAVLPAELLLLEPLHGVTLEVIDDG